MGIFDSIDIGGMANAYKDGGFFGAATLALTNRYGGANNANGATPQVVQAALASPPVQGAPINPQSTVPVGTRAWWKTPLAWIAGGGLLLVALLMFKPWRK